MGWRYPGSLAVTHGPLPSLLGCAVLALVGLALVRRARRLVFAAAPVGGIGGAGAPCALLATLGLAGDPAPAPPLVVDRADRLLCRRHGARLAASPLVAPRRLPGGGARLRAVRCAAGQPLGRILPDGRQRLESTHRPGRARSGRPDDRHGTA